MKRFLVLLLALTMLPVFAEKKVPLLKTVNEIDLGTKIHHARATGVVLGGRRHLLIKHSSSSRIDPWQEAFQYPTDSYKLTLVDFENNKVLWTKDLGMGIVTGDWFCPVLSFDIDGDGDDEIFFMDNNRPKFPLSIDRSLVGLRAKDGKEFMRFRVKLTVSTPSETYRFVLLGGKNSKGVPVLVVQNGTYGLMEFFAYDKNGKSLWKRAITKDGTPRASHCSNTFDFNNDGADEILWGERLISLDNGKDVAIGTEDGWDAHSDIVMPVIAGNGKCIGFWDCRESNPTEGREKEQFRCNYYDENFHIRWGLFKNGNMDKGGVIRAKSDGEKIFWVQEDPSSWNAKDRKRVPARFFDMEGKELPHPLGGKNMAPPRPIDVDGDGVHELAFDNTVYNLKGEAVARFRGSRIIVAHVRDDLPGEQFVGHEGSKVFVLADPNAKWSEAGKKRYAHPFYNACLHHSAVGYNWAYDLAGL